MFYFARSQTRKKTKRKTTAKRMAKMTTPTTATQSEPAPVSVGER